MGLRDRFDNARDRLALAETRRQLERIERHYEYGERMEPEDDLAHGRLAYEEYRLLERLGDHEAIRARLDGTDNR